MHAQCIIAWQRQLGGASAYSSVNGEQPEGASLFVFPQPGGVVPSSPSRQVSAVYLGSD
jgi:hypothetical protein